MADIGTKLQAPSIRSGNSGAKDVTYYLRMAQGAQGRESPHSPLVTVVMLSYSHPEFLEQALESIARQTYPNLEVIVVNNRSPQTEAIRELVAGYPKFRLIAINHNSGYTGGMNEGIRHATGKYIYLTEEDMVTEPGAIAAMVEYMESDSRAGMTSGVIDDHLGATIFAGGFTELGKVFKQFLFGRGTPVLPPIGGPFCMNYASGALMMFRRAALEELGGFREDFFMYYEDVEMCQRFRRTNRAIVLVPTARAVTLGEGPLKVDSRHVSYHKMKNLMAVSLLYIRLREIPEFLLRYAVWNLLRDCLRNRSAALALFCADLWIAANFPRLMWDRWRFARRQQSNETEFCSVGAHSV